MLTAVLGVGIGLLGSAFARTEFQAVQLLPIVVIPQILLCGLFVPREEMGTWLQVLSDLMPLTYAVDALQQVGLHSEPTGQLWRDLAVIAGEARPAQIAEALAWAGKHRAALALQWAELNERG